MHNATAITTGSANQRPNTLCIRMWIDVTFRELEDSYRHLSTGIGRLSGKNNLAEFGQFTCSSRKRELYRIRVKFLSTGH